MFELQPIRFRLTTLDFRRTYVMGVLNVTPDSFSDGGCHPTLDAAVAHGLRLVEEGADIIDVGGESTRPGARPVSADEERARVVAVVARLAERTTVSIDTCKAEVAEAALAAGAEMVNDVSGGLHDPGILGVVARARAALVLGHLRGTPRDMAEHAEYTDVVAEVRAELAARLAAARAAGVDAGRIFLDPGLGFAKRADHSLLLLQRLDSLAGLGRPLVIGASRKSFLGQLTGLPTDERETATAAAHTVAILGGAQMVRVHAVRAQRAAVRVADALRQGPRA